MNYIPYIILAIVCAIIIALWSKDAPIQKKIQKKIYHIEEKKIQKKIFPE